MKSERRKKQQNQFQEKQIIIDTKTRNDIAKLLAIAKINNEKINKIDEDLNSNPFTKLFKVKGKVFWRYLIVLLITVIIMIGVYLLWFKWVYDWNFNSKNTVEIFGNGLFWIIAGLFYFGVDYIISKKGWFENAKR